MRTPLASPSSLQGTSRSSTRGLQGQDFRDTFILRFQDGSHATFHGTLALHDPAAR